MVEGTGTKARFKGAVGIAVDADGILYVADAGNRRVRRISKSGVVSTLAGAGSEEGSAVDSPFIRPAGIAVSGDGTVYVQDDTKSIYTVSAAGSVKTLVDRRQGR
jgi:glucose/arabinose dehydrogenase